MKIGDVGRVSVTERARRAAALDCSLAMRLAVPLAACCFCLAAGCRPAQSTSSAPAAPSGATSRFLLRDATRDSGISYRHTDGSSGQRYIVESVSTGLATFDFDGDRRIDIYFPNGNPLRGTKGEATATQSLCRNEGDFHFRDVSRQAGIDVACYGLGATAGDYDGDGFQDLYLSNYGENVLYHNNGDGTFSDVTSQAGVGRGNRVGAGVSLLDIDKDGDLDLYVSNYVDFTYENHVVRSIDGVPSYSGPRNYRPVPDNLFRNNGDGTFTDISRESGIGLVAGTGMGIVCADYDNDDDTDVFVCNDSFRNFFFRNDGTGRFEEVGAMIGSAYNYLGDENASMGVDCADYNHDGRLDFYMTDYGGELPILYENAGGGFLNDVTRRAKAGAGLLPHVKWGCGFADFDNDGNDDIYVACGHLDDNVGLRTDATAYRVPNVLLAGESDGTFHDVSAEAGDGMRATYSSRGAAFDDLDNDGTVDAVVLNSREAPTVLRNAAASNGNHWIEILLHGTAMNRDGVGAHVQVAAGGVSQLKEVHSGRGYQGHFGTRLHFGLGTATRLDRMEVRWLGGSTEVFENVPVDRLVLIVQGQGIQ